jgi:UDP-N-acetylmuramoyl-tripeptide--D-alanyl-D-alanine ligase
VWHVDEVIRAVKGVPFRIDGKTFTGISTDSRSISEGELFIPLRGPSFDGHEFMKVAYERSRMGTLCEKGRQHLLEDLQGTVIVVEDTLKALLDLARFRRDQRTGTFIAITGSNGKTTTKEIVVDMLKRAFPVHCNEKNYNNLIGVSKSILSMNGDRQFYVFELGTNSRGEIRELAEVVKPRVSLITNINPSHLEGLSDLEGVLEEKMDLFLHTAEGGTVLVNADDPLIMSRFGDLRRRALTFGIRADADFQLQVMEDLGWAGFRVSIGLAGETLEANTPLLGVHNLYNILSACAIAHTAGLGKDYIRETVETFAPYSMRFRPFSTRKGFTVIDDSYNANPASMAWAVKTILSLPCEGKRVVIIGDMRELGDKTGPYHRELGRLLKESSIDITLLLGECVKETFRELGEDRAQLFDDRQALIEYALAHVDKGDVVLVKGSRASKMDEIVEALR